ncbi:hypothetical protein CPC08DRAFT_613986, partial [Agrocybe pediades]
LGPSTKYTIDDGEMVAGLLAAWMLQSSPHIGPNTASIYTDSQNFIKATQSRIPASGSHILESFNEIATNLKGPNNEQIEGPKFTLRWIVAHNKSRGNKKADIEAKRAARGGVSTQNELPHYLR